MNRLRTPDETAADNAALRQQDGVASVIDQTIGERFAMYHGDCCEVTKGLPSDSVGLTVFSPPFSSLYIYSDSDADMGNCADDEEFIRHFEFLIPEMYRITIPGRICAIHCKDLPTYRNSDGAAGLRDFPGLIITAMERHGWQFHSRVTVWKCPVTERERTNNNGLLHKTVMRDSSQIRMGMADYVICFRKTPAAADGNLSAQPIVRAKGFDRWIGDPATDPRTTDTHPSKHARHGRAGNQSVEMWRRYAEPVWWDIDQTDVLNFEMVRENPEEKHICPLQLGLIRRIVYLWSQEGDVVFSPFAGIGSEGHVAIEEGRRFIGIELKDTYYRWASKNLETAERLSKAQATFDFAEPEEEACEIA